MNRNILAFSALVLGLVISFGFITKSDTDPAPAKVNWITIEEAAALAEQDGKKILVDVYTDWCGWCKRMDKATYENPEIVEILNANFHAVKFNAEQKEDVTIKGQSYKYVANGRRGYHELAARLLSGKLSYPSTVFLNSDFSMLYNVPGYREPKEFSTILGYTQEEGYKRVSFQDYVNNQAAN